MINFLAAISTSLPEDFFGRILFILQTYGGSLAKGAGSTLLIAFIGTFVGCIIGFIVGIIQSIPFTPQDGPAKKIILRIVKVILKIYVEVFRGTPMMVQAMFIYYGAMLLLGLNMNIWVAAFFIVSINTGAYMAETVRGGMISVPIGQTEGAKAIGMTHFQTMLNVIMPQALRNIMPQIGNNLIINIKDTCVLSAIGVSELFFTSKSVSGTYYIYFEVFTVTMAMYLVMTLFFSWVLRVVERKMDGPKSYNLENGPQKEPTGYELDTTDTLAYTSGTLTNPRKSQTDGRK